MEPTFPWGDEKALEEIIRGLGSLDELEQVLAYWIGTGDITEEEAFAYYDQYAPLVDPYTYFGASEEVKNYLNEAISKDDLADRLVNLGLDDATTSQLYEAISWKETPTTWAIREAKGDVVKAQEKIQLGKEERARDLTQYYDKLRKQNPDITPQAWEDIMGQVSEQQEGYIEGESDEIFRNLDVLTRTAGMKSRIEGQTAESLLAEFYKPREKPPEREMPAISGARGIVEPFLEGTRLGEGTRLRSFIESEIPGMVEETARARADWWRRMHPGREEEQPSYQSEQARISGEAQRWGEMARTAPSSEVAGGTYYGPGGLAALAQGAYERSQKELAGLKPGAFEKPGTSYPEPITEDPLKLALKRRKFMSEFYRRPGAGLARSLTPAARW